MTKPRYRLQADGNVVAVTDSLTNVTANLGTSRDKSAWSVYGLPMLSDQELVNAYRGAWLPRKIVDIPALDSCRKWRDWQATKEQITAIEGEEKRLGVRGKMMQARTRARLFGGAAVLIGTGDADPSKPINVANLKSGGIRYLTVLSKSQVQAGQINLDAASEFYGKPGSYSLNTTASAQVIIHPSRLVVFHGAPPIDDTYMAFDAGWGDSVLLAVMSAIKNNDNTAANVASLVFEAKVDTVGIPDFMQKLGDPAYQDILLKRWALAETGKGINGTLMHDAEEMLGQKTASFTTLPEIMDRFLQMVSGAADIPATRLLGISPSGMSATGESDMRNYYDRISAAQELEMGPAMHVLDECLIRSALGIRPEEIHYKWASLWQISDTERAAIGKTIADTAKVLHDAEILPDAVIGEATANALIEAGVMPGLEAAIEEYGLGIDDPTAEELLAAQTPKQPVPELTA